MDDTLELLRTLVRECLDQGGQQTPQGYGVSLELKYKRSIDCSHPKGFSQKNYCKRRKRGGAYRDD